MVVKYKRSGKMFQKDCARTDEGAIRPRMRMNPGSTFVAEIEVSSDDLGKTTPLGVFLLDNLPTNTESINTE